MYPFKEIEARWREYWEKTGLYKTPDNPKKKFYLLEMFAYPSGDIHLGHFRNYTIGDVIWRYKRMQGYDILHPFGWDAFGLPAEQAAIKHKIPPDKWTFSNIARSRNTLKRLSISYDWDKEIITASPDYYRWTQWVFLKLYESGLVYRDMSFVNWCPSCKTVLANEQVIAGRCWRCESVVEKRRLEQWFVRITAYAERLLEGLDRLKGWPENIKTMQRNWIGRSEGTEIDFKIEGTDKVFSVFTTRPDTIFGVTFVTFAPEQPLVDELLGIMPNKEEVERYVQQALLKPEIERSFDGREKDGVFTGLYAINPYNGERVAVWVADYVLASYGTGVVMAVPAHDQRDFEFAKRYGLPIKVVINPPGCSLDPSTMDAAYTESGIMTNSGAFDGLPSTDGIKKVTEYGERCGFARSKVIYKLRDWLISRQRYWGAPIPVVHCEKCGTVPVPEDALPVLLPPADKVNFIPQGRSPLEDLPEFMNTICPVCGGTAHRDPDTMDTFVCSSWYHLRYTDPKNEEEPFSRQDANRWMPVDLYIGGAEHATGHLLYFRFITKLLHDLGYLDVDEPAIALFNHGMVLDANGAVMSKSKGNVVSPMELIENYGVDTVRVGMLFMAPPERELLWSSEGLKGASRFLERVYNFFCNLSGNEEIFDFDQLPDVDKLRYRKLHWAIKRVKDDIENIQFNTAVAAMMEFLNTLGPRFPDDSSIPNYIARRFIKLLAPFAPHLAEEIWHRMGEKDSIFLSPFPDFDPAALVAETVTIAIQINGKLRATINLPPDSDEEAVVASALELDKVRKYVEGKQIVKRFYVKDKLINIVVK